MDSGVAKFFLIDQSLKGVGGHHFDYSCQIANAAMTGHSLVDSYENPSGVSHFNLHWPVDSNVIIGANKKFSSVDSFPNCEVRSCFRYTTYARSSNLIGIQEMVGRRKKTGWIRSLFGGGESEQAFELDRKKRISTFRDNLQTFFQEELNEADVVFFATLSDLEADGLRQFIAERPDAKKANWHLQFHFPIFLGRTAEYAEQDFRLDSIRPVFDQLELLRGDTNIQYYVTSEPLREQYTRLGVDFENLPYPIDPDFRKSNGNHKSEGAEASCGEAFRLTFAGASRKEKGELAIRELANDLPKEFVQRNNVKIVTQQKKQKFWRRLKGRLKRTRVEPESSVFEEWKFPLSDSQYRELIKRTNIGLLTTYDSRTYFSRRAGILGEYLAAGIPVVVPAGCWLSEQIEGEQQNYLRQIVAPKAMHTNSKTVNVVDGGLIHVDLSEMLGQGVRNAGPQSRMLVVSIEATEELPIYDFVEVSRIDENDQQLDSQIVGMKNSNRKQCERGVSQDGIRHFAFYVEDSDAKVQFKIQNAFEHKTASMLNISQVKVTILDSEKPIPRSAVGMVAADPSQAAELIQEMVSQYSHYQGTAKVHSEEWYRDHDPKLTFSTLLNHSHSLLKLELEANDVKVKPERTAA